MDKKKKHYPREQGKNEEAASNGQRISVRPGNFTPPAAPKKEGAPAQGGNQAAQGGNQGAQGGHQGHGGRNRNRHRRGNRPQQGAAQGAPQQKQEERREGAERHGSAPRPQQNQPRQGGNPTQGKGQQGGNQAGNQGGNQGGRGRNRHRRGGKGEGRQQQQPKQEPQVLSEALQRELDEDFSTPTLSSFSPSLQSGGRVQRKTRTAVDSEEFAVDIATASYLVEDVPCGFPIPDGKAVEVVGVRFRRAGRIYFFAPEGNRFAIGDRAIVDTARGPEIGDIVMLNRRIAEKDVVQPLRPVLRRATPEDEAHAEENCKKEAEALKVCAEKVAWHKLDMRLVDAQYTFDNSKLLFYFTSDGRVDFRELVRDLAGYFHTRIELRQIGIRDESRLIGGLGMCGRPFCCATFLSDFGQVSVKMAKEQGLSINASKISGCCGRLMCCLRYEHETYVAEAKLTPKKDAVVQTPDGRGVVVDSTPLLGSVKVKLDELPEEPARVYHRDDLTPVSRGSSRPDPTPAEEPKEESEQASGSEAMPEDV